MTKPKKPPFVQLDDQHVKCPTCGATVDLRQHDQVLLHQDPGHKKPGK
jgi:hypothetical protein